MNVKTTAQAALAYKFGDLCRIVEHIEPVYNLTNSVTLPYTLGDHTFSPAFQVLQKR